MKSGFLIGCMFLGLSGCVAVKPYERELLAQPGMSLASGVSVESQQHMLESREASFGGYGSSGGGCGCN
jgi:starvation-inducible outer membrane lipoprotein